MGIGFYILYQRHSMERLEADHPSYLKNTIINDSNLNTQPGPAVVNYLVEENLPFGIETNNPVPEVKHWNFNKRTYYYFNWGLKKTGGYSLEILSVKNHVIKIKAQSPHKDQMLIEALTFPALLISLPQGDYAYEVFNEKGCRIQNIFSPKREPLKMLIFVPKTNGQIAKREILRDVSCRETGKPALLIALESLFNQQEMLDFINRGVTPEKVVFDKTKQQWIVQLSKTFQDLTGEEKKLLCDVIRKTVLTFAINPSATVKIVSDPVAAIHS